MDLIVIGDLRRNIHGFAFAPGKGGNRASGQGGGRTGKPFGAAGAAAVRGAAA